MDETKAEQRARELQESWAAAREVFTLRAPVSGFSEAAALPDKPEQLAALLRPNGLAGFTGRWFPTRCPSYEGTPARPAHYKPDKLPTASADNAVVEVEPIEGDDPGTLPLRWVIEGGFDPHRWFHKAKTMGVRDSIYYRYRPARYSNSCTVLPLGFLDKGRFERWRLQPPEVFGVHAEETVAAAGAAVNRVNDALRIPDKLWKALFAAVPFGWNLTVAVEPSPPTIPFSQLHPPKLMCFGITGFEFYGLGRYDSPGRRLTLYAPAIESLATAPDLTCRFAFVLSALLFLAWADFQTDLPMSMDLLIRHGRANTPPMELDVYAVYFAQRFVEDVLDSGAGRAALRSALLPNRSDARVSKLTALETADAPTAAFLRALEAWRGEMLNL